MKFMGTMALATYCSLHSKARDKDKVRRKDSLSDDSLNGHRIASRTGTSHVHDVVFRAFVRRAWEDGGEFEWAQLESRLRCRDERSVRGQARHVLRA